MISEQKSLYRQREYISTSKVGINFLKFLFIFGCAGSLLLHAVFLWLCWLATLYCGVQASHCGGFSLGSTGFRVQAQSCGARAELPCGTWGLPQSGIEPVSPTLGGGFLTTGPPGKFQELIWSIQAFFTLDISVSVNICAISSHSSHTNIKDKSTN